MQILQRINYHEDIARMLGQYLDIVEKAQTHEFDYLRYADLQNEFHSYLDNDQS